MAPKKKGSNNGYYSLVMELAKSMSRARAEEEAQRMWPRMSAVEREPYNSTAKKGKGSLVKMTAVNENMDHVNKEEEALVQREQNMHKDIQATVKALANNEELGKEYFHIIHLNNFFITTNNLYFPAEIGLVRFNLEDGVVDANVYDTQIRPGKFPMGYLGTAKKISDETHKIPYMDTENCNLNNVIRDLFEFLKESAAISGKKNIFPPLYVNDSLMKMTYDILQQVCNDYDYDFDKLKIYSLPYLMLTIHNTIKPSAPWISVSHAKIELDKDVYDLTPGIACQFHQMEESSEYCSRSHVVRMAYIVCDNLCQDLDIPLIPGRHVPLNSLTVPQVTASTYAESTVFSTCNGNSTYASSVAPSYRSNVNTLEFDDKSTINGDDEDSDYRGPESAPSVSTIRYAASVSSRPGWQPGDKDGPRTDWRKTQFGNRGRGRGVNKN